MSAKKPLYRDEQLWIDHHPTSTSDYIIFIDEKNGQRRAHFLKGSILEDLATTPRGKIKTSLLSSDLIDSINREGIGLDGLHIALCQTYTKKI